MSTSPFGYLQFLANGPAEPVPVGHGALIVGRSPKADVTLDDPKASRKHCQVRAGEDGRVVVEDLGSTSGTHVNGKRITAAYRLQQGDKVRVGHTELVFVRDKQLADALATDAREAAEAAEPESEAFAPVGVAAAAEREVPPDTPYLEPIAGADGLELPARIHLVNPRTVLGRRPECDIVVKTTSISGQHGEFLRDGDGSVRLRDLNSTNGVRVNGHKVTEATLHTDDVLSVERFALRYVNPAEPPPDPPQPRFVVLVGEWIAPIVVVGDEEITIGRNKHTNSHPLRNDTEASAMHVRVYTKDGRVYAEDVGSTNGTRVDGQKIEASTPVPLGHGSKLKIGNTILRFEDPSAPPAEPAAGPVGDEQDTLSDEAVAVEDVLGAVSELDLSADEGDVPAAAATAMVKTRKLGSSTAVETADEQQEMQAFLHPGRGRRRSRLWVWRAAEVTLLLGLLAGVALVLLTGARGGPREEATQPAAIRVPHDSLIVTNWSFEQTESLTDGDARRVPGWELFGARYDALFADAARARNGRRSLTVVRDTADFGSTDVLSVDVIPLQPGQVLSAQADVRGGRGGRSQPGGGGLKVVFFADAAATQPLASVVSEFRRPAEWQPAQLAVAVPDGARSARVGVSVIGGHQRISFDDVVARLAPAAAAEQAVTADSGSNTDADASANADADADADADSGTAVVAAAASRPAVVQVGRTRRGPFEWRLAADGSFELLQHIAADADADADAAAAAAAAAEPGTAGGVPPRVLLGHADVVVRKLRDRAISRLFDLAGERLVAVDENGMRITVQVANPFAGGRSGADTAERVPVTAVRLTLGWQPETGAPVVNVAANQLEELGEIGILVDVPEYATRRLAARFVETAEETRLSYHPLPLRSSQGDVLSGTRLMLPLAEAGYLHLGPLPAPASARNAREAAAVPATRVEGNRRPSGVEVLLLQAGQRATLPLALDPFAAEAAAVREAAAQARSLGDDTAAIAAIVRELALSLHDPEAVRAVEVEFAHVVSPLEYQIGEVHALLETLDRSFSRRRLDRAQQQAAELRRRLDVEQLAALPTDVLARTRVQADRPAGSPFAGEAERAPRPGRPAEVDPHDHVAQVLTTVRASLVRLQEWQAKFHRMQEARHAEVDASLLARWEEQVAPLLVRAQDLDRAGRRAMAATLYRRVLREVPLSRPATVARQALVTIAQQMAAEAAAVAEPYPERAKDLRLLVGTLAEEVLATDWPHAAQAGAEPGTPWWDAAAQNWAAGRSAEVVASFYAVIGATAAQPAAEPGQPPVADDVTAQPWRGLAADEWRWQEVLAREQALRLLAEHGDGK